MATLLHLVARQNNDSEPVPVPLPVPVPVQTGPVRHGSPVVAFIIGLSIIILASVLNAAGLNLTKLDHVFVPPASAFVPGANLLLRTRRSEVVQFQRAHGRKTGYDRYGFLACYFTCEAPRLSVYSSHPRILDCPNSSDQHSH
jgi:hypothetical protein